MLADAGVLTVVANTGQAHPQGVKVYNLEVEQAHTYFVLAEHAPDGADAVWAHNASYVKKAKKFTTQDLEGNFANIDPRTNTVRYSPQSALAGDHVLPQSAFKTAIGEYELVNGPMPLAMRKQLLSLQNGSEDLRMMHFGLNSSKQDLTALEFVRTPQGRTVDIDYIVDLAFRQESVARRANGILGGSFVPARYTGQLRAILEGN